MAGIAAGRLRHRINFEEPIETQDGTTGEVTIAWQTAFENVPAEINERVVRESVGDGQMQVTTSITITVRWRTGYNAKQRIVWLSPTGLRYFNMAGLLPDTETGRAWFEIPVVELI